MFISPMLLHKSYDGAFDDPNYVSELKLDGFRCIWSKFENKVRIWTRHHTEITDMFPELVDLDICEGTILDGEIVVNDSLGKPNFEAVMERLKSKKSPHSISFCVFDILYYKNKKITQLELLQRKAILKEAIPEDTPLLTKVKWIVGNGGAFFDLIKQQDLEGIVMKKANSKYQVNKRSHDWLKVINYSYLDVLITGMVKKDNSFLLSSINEGTNIGVMEFVPNQERKYIHEKLRDIGVKETDKLIIFNEGIKCNVKFRNWTSNQKLRIPSFHTWIS